MHAKGSLKETALRSLLEGAQSERATGTLTVKNDGQSYTLYFLFGHLFHATGEGATLKAQEDAPKLLNKQIRESVGGVPDQDQLKRTEDSRVPVVVGPGHVGGSKGVSENMLKEATKVNANPK